MKNALLGYLRTSSLVVATLTATAAASCYIVAPTIDCCSTVSVFDGVGDCPGESFDCPDVPSLNPTINQVQEVALGTAGAKNGYDPVPYNCEFQPRKCTPTGCVDFGPPETRGCWSRSPSGLNCPSGPPE